MERNVVTSAIVMYLFLLSAPGWAQPGVVREQGHLAADRGLENAKKYLARSLDIAGSDGTSALIYADSAYQLALQYGDSAQLVAAGAVSGQLLLSLNKIDRVINLLDQILPVAERNKFVEQTRILNTLAIAHTYGGNFEKALKYNFQSLTIREEEGNKRDIGIALTNIGFVFFKLDNFREALVYYNRALSLKLETSDESGLSSLLINIGLCRTQLGDYAAALSGLRMSSRLCGLSCDPSIRMQHALALGMVYVGIKKTDSAILCLGNSLRIAKDIGNTVFQLENMKTLGGIYLNRGETKVASALLDEAERLASHSENTQILCDIYEKQSDLNSRMSNYRRAWEYRIKYAGLYERTMREKLGDLLRVQSDFNERENKKIIENQNQVLKLKQAIIKSHQQLIALIGIVVVLLVFFVFNLLKRYRRKQSDNLSLNLKVRERTQMVEGNLSELTRNNEEQNLHFLKTASEMKVDLIRLQGLLNILTKDPHNKESVVQSTTFIHTTQEKLSEAIDRIGKAC